MAKNQRVQVVTNQRGAILAVLRLPDEAPSSQEGSAKQHAEVRVTPMPGQFVADAMLPDEIGALETIEDFKRLVAEFELPRNATALRRKKVREKATAGKATGRERPRSKRITRSR